MLNTIRDRITASTEYNLLALVIAGWMRHTCDLNQQSEKISIQDALADHFAQIAAQDNGDAEQLVRQFST